MKKENIQIKSDCDNLLLDTTIFIPDKNIKGIVQFSHGMAEHKERYYSFMKYLTNNGYITVIHDHRGHGKSIKNKDDLGYFYDEDASYIVKDLYQVTKYIKDKYKGLKIVLFGHSMGSLVVRKYIKEYDDFIDKLIVCGSPSNNKGAKIAYVLSSLIGKVKTDHYRSKFIDKLAFGSYNKKVKEGSWICKNKESYDEYEKDPLCGFVFTTNGFKNLFRLVMDVYSKNGWKMNNKDLPILFIAGEKDPVIINEDKWKDSQEFLRKRGYNNISSILYEDMHHEILNEKDNKKVYKDILMFIEK